MGVVEMVSKSHKNDEGGWWNELKGSNEFSK